MGSLFIMERDFVVPIWANKEARKILNRYTGFADAMNGIQEVSYTHEHLMIFIKYTVEVKGNPGHVKSALNTIETELKNANCTV